MPPFTPSISLFMGIFVSYSVGLILGWWSNKLLELVFELSAVSRETDSEKRLRTEVRDNVSRIILEVLESGEEPNLLNVAESCPTQFRTGNAWALWQRESYQMLKDILAEDLTQF